MSIYPKLTFTLLNGFLLIIPLLLLRFGLPALIRKTSLTELDYFPPLQGREITAQKVYFVTNTFLIFSPLLARVRLDGLHATLGWIIYLVGILVLALSLFEYSRRREGFSRNGIYRFSRNPMYIGYFLLFIGMSLLIGSWFHLLLTLVYQVAVHYLILSEERWCRQTFGEAYLDYEKKVRRYM